MGRPKRTTPPDRITRAQLAQLLGVHEATIARRQERGLLPSAPERTVPMAAAYEHAKAHSCEPLFLAWYARTYGHAYEVPMAATSGAKPTPTSTPSSAGSSTPAPRAPVSRGIDYWKTVEAREKAKKLRLQRLRVEGSLVDREAAAMALQANAVMVRDRLRELPDRLAPQLAAETSAASVRAILREAIDEVLTELATNIGETVDAPEADGEEDDG